MKVLSILLIIAAVILVAVATGPDQNYGRGRGYRGRYRTGYRASSRYRYGSKYRPVGGYGSGRYRTGGGYRSGGSYGSGGSYRSGGSYQQGSHYSYGYKKAVCVKLSDPANGNVKLTGVRPGDRATYTCNTGFVLVGNDKRICSRDGKWFGSAPICKPVDCGVLPRPKNGAVSFYPGTTFRSTATFTCRRGFRLTGSKVRTCQANGKWSGSQTSCIRTKCPKVSPPKYGKVYASGFHPGDHLRYKCTYGYSLNGPSKRVCLRSGKWGGRDAHCVKDEYPYGHPKPYHYDDENWA